MPVIHPKNRDRQAGSQLDEAVQRIQEEEVYHGIHRCPKQHPSHLRFEVAAVRADEKNGHGCNAAPVRGEGDGTDKKGQQDFLPVFVSGAVVEPQKHKTPGQRPYDTGLVKDGSLKGKEIYYTLMGTNIIKYLEIVPQRV